MQNWKLIQDAAPAPVDPSKKDRQIETLIRDSGFASTSHPKLKFNFTMDIAFRAGNTIGADSMEMMDIPLKTATRPNQTVNLVDVNYYNYRTKVATKMEVGTATVVMYDDGDNKAHNIYTQYINAISPISNTQILSDIDNPLASKLFGQMSSIGGLPNNPNGIIRSLSIYHFYSANSALHRTQYKYLNPKIQAFELDELSMSESDTNSISMTFVYDAVNITDEKM
jgi:hypothetical protein